MPEVGEIWLAGANGDCTNAGNCSGTCGGVVYDCPEWSTASVAHLFKSPQNEGMTVNGVTINPGETIKIPRNFEFESRDYIYPATYFLSGAIPESWDPDAHFESTGNPNFEISGLTGTMSIFNGGYGRFSEGVYRKGGGTGYRLVRTPDLGWVFFYFGQIATVSFSEGETGSIGFELQPGRFEGGWNPEAGSASLTYPDGWVPNGDKFLAALSWGIELGPVEGGFSPRPAGSISRGSDTPDTFIVPEGANRIAFDVFRLASSGVPDSSIDITYSLLVNAACVEPDP